MPTTVASSAAIPDPSTVAATTQRPRALRYLSTSIPPLTGNRITCDLIDRPQQTVSRGPVPALARVRSRSSVLRYVRTVKGAGGGGASERVSYDVRPDVSAVLIQARSNVGPIELASTSISGYAEATLTDGVLDMETPPTASIDIPVVSLSSGNARYDREIHRRLDAQRYPQIAAELATARLSGSSGLAVAGSLTIHGMTVTLAGNFDVESVDSEQLRVAGEQLIDIRDFSISLPTTLMLRIYPEVIVRFRIECARTS
jgi:YceI-like domain